MAALRKERKEGKEKWKEDERLRRNPLVTTTNPGGSIRCVDQSKAEHPLLCKYDMEALSLLRLAVGC